MSRSVLNIPIVHGDLEVAIPEANLVVNDEGVVDDKKAKALLGVWDIIRKKILDLDVDFSKVKVYPEGFTKDAVSRLLDMATMHGELSFDEMRRGMSDLSKEEVYDLFRDEGAPLTQTVSYLLLHGATIVPTEDAKISGKTTKVIRDLYMNYFLQLEDVDNPYKRKDLLDMRSLAQKFADYQRERDKVAVNTINSSLEEGEVGIVLWGAAHDISKSLASDIFVKEIPQVGEEIRAIIGETRPLHSVESVREITNAIAKENGFKPLDDFSPSSPEARG